MDMKKGLFVSLLIGMSLAMSAQQLPKLPLDSAIRFGRLDNGLTYYIRHHEQPKQRCDFHIAQAVGAVLEEDNQNGLAHFLEHMAFNGTQHYPGKGIINYFESIGVNFGGNINAYTSIDETVYRLSDVPTIREGIIDSALLVMHDWACGLLLLPEEIDAERGVIREEWRTRNNANGRMGNIIRAKLYPNSQYGKRDIIGDTAVINNFEYEALRSYYKKWYGPDNQAIIVVGDIDVDAIEAKIKALWADVPARANRGERPLYTVDFYTAPTVAIATDKEAQQTRISVEYLHEQIPEPFQGTQAEYAQTIMHQMIRMMLSHRFEELAMQPSAATVGYYTYYAEQFKLRDAFEAICVPKEGRETDALVELLTQLEKMRRYGFTTSELERAKTDILNNYEKSYNERSTRKNQTLAREYIRNFTRHETCPGIEWEYEFVKQMVPMVTVDMVNQMAKAYFTPNPGIAIMGPEKEGVKIPTEQEVLDILKQVEAMEIEAPAEEQIDNELVKKAPKMGAVKKRTVNAELGTTELLLKNGIRVIIKPTEFKQDEINLYAYSDGGKSLIETTDLPSAMLTTDVISFMGLGDFSYMGLQKALTGKTVRLNGNIGAYEESISGSSSVKDFETMLQLLYLSFTAPRRDDEAYQTLMGMLATQLANKDKNHKAIFRDSVSMMAADHSERVTLLNTELLDKVSVDKVLEIYSARFANPADFTFIIVGNINPQDNAQMALISKWLGGLKTKCKKEHYHDRGVRAPKGEQKNYFTRDMQIKTATNRIQYTSYDIPYTLANALNMEVISRVLDMRYLESVREREGGSYGVHTGGYLRRTPVPCAILLMQFDTDPLKQEKLMSIIHEEVQTIIKDGPREDDLQKAKESMLKDFAEDLEQNGWWMDALEDYYRYDEDLVADYAEAVKSVTAESVQALLKKLVASGNMFEVVMMPE